MLDITKTPVELGDRTLTKLQKIMAMAKTASSMSTCSRLSVGAVITDLNLRVLSIGYNGRKKGVVHCCDSNPDGLKSECKCIHAEQNAFAFDIHPKSIERLVFVTTFPCDSCMKMLAANNVVCVYYMDEYDYYESSAQIALDNSIKFYKLSPYKENQDGKGIK